MLHRHTANIRCQEELMTPSVLPLCLGPHTPAFHLHQRDQVEPETHGQWLPLPLLGTQMASIFLPPLSAMDPCHNNTSPVSIVCTGDAVMGDLSKAPVPLPTRLCLPLRVSYQRTPSQGSVPTLVIDKRTAEMPELPLLPKLCELEDGAIQGHLSLPKTRLQPRYLV
jgi:hypothetical protein